MTKIHTITVQFKVPKDEADAGVWDYAKATLEAKDGSKAPDYYVGDVAYRLHTGEQLMSVTALDDLLALIDACFDSRQDTDLSSATRKMELHKDFKKKYCWKV